VRRKGVPLVTACQGLKTHESSRKKVSPRREDGILAQHRSDVQKGDLDGVVLLVCHRVRDKSAHHTQDEMSAPVIRYASNGESSTEAHGVHEKISRLHHKAFGLEMASVGLLIGM
jgi:hypothetical protein